MTPPPTPPAPLVSDEPAGAPGPHGRSLGRSVAIGVAVGIAVAAIAFFLIAIPFYTLASFEPDGGLDRPIVRTGLFKVAMPVGAIVGVLSGAATGRWLHRGGHWAADDGGDRYSNR